jgi:type VI secretion system protein ImpA
LGEIRQAVSKYAPSAATAAGQDDFEGFDDEELQDSTGAVGAVSVSGAINNKTDVINMIDKICDYYASHEPSSPIPLLLRRAQRLVDKSFVEILEDLAPDGVDQLQVISGESD